MVVHDVVVRCGESVGVQVPVSGPSQRVVGDPTRPGHHRETDVRRFRDQYVDQVAFQLRRSTGASTGVDQPVEHPGSSVDLDEQRRELDRGEQGFKLIAQSLSFGADGVGGQRRDDEIAVVVDADSADARLVREHGFEFADSVA